MKNKYYEKHIYIITAIFLLYPFYFQGIIKYFEEEIPAKTHKGFPHIKILFTAALIPHTYYKSREYEYKNSLSQLLRFGYEPYVIESCKKGPTFFENYTSHVYYWGENNPSLKNKGVNEVRSIIFAIEQLDFKEEDTIIKITGRYHLDTRKFLDIVEQHPEMDVIYTSRNPNGSGVFSGCFAMRYRLLKEMLYQIDTNKMEKEKIDFEYEVEKYISKIASSQKKFVKEIDMTVNIAGGGRSGLPRTEFQ